MKLDDLRGKLVYQGILLGSVTLLTGGALALADRATEEDIKAAQARDMQQSLAQVLPGQYDNDLLKDTVTLPGPDGNVTVYRARRAGKVEAVVFQVQGQGYAGPVVSMMGVDRNGQVLGVRVINHKETPGLGDKVDPAKSDWIHAFEHKFFGDPPEDKWAVKKDGGVFDQFSGATITPRAVVKSVKGGLEFFRKQKTRLLDDKTVEAASAVKSGAGPVIAAKAAAKGE
jgi:electron transport complex protein RnfG